MSKRTIEQFHAETSATVKQIREALAEWPEDTVVTSAEVIVDEDRSIYDARGMANYYIVIDGEREVK